MHLVTAQMSNSEQVLKEINAQRDARPDTGTPFVPPRTRLEKETAGAVAAVLHLERVGVHDSLYELGASSLEAVQVLLRVGDAFGVTVPMRTLVAGKLTVDEIARAVARCKIEKADEAEVAALLERLEGLSDEEARALLTDSHHDR
jgi:acyl carrier protein